MSPKRLILAAVLLAAIDAHGQTRYVSDDLVVTMRTGPSTQNAIVLNLDAGDEVQVLEQDQAQGYSRVTVVGQGSEGWVLSRYLVSQPIARDRLITVERDLSSAQARIVDLEQQLDGLTEQFDATQQELQQAQALHSEAAAELEYVREASANAVSIREQNETLRQRLSDTDQRLEAL